MPMLPIDQARIPNGGTEIPRLREESYLASEYKAAFLGYGGWGEFPPITVDQDLLILDGVTRYLGAQAAGLDEVLANIVHCDTPGERLLIAAKGNAQHGKRWETKDIVMLSNLAERFNVAAEDLAGALRVPISRVERVPVATVTRTTSNGAIERERVYVKRPVRGVLNGREITEREANLMERLSTANAADTVLADFVRLAELGALPPLNDETRATAERARAHIDAWIMRDKHLV